MKKLAKRLDKYADLSMVELTKWTRQLLYEFLIEFISEMLQNEEERTNR